METSKNTAIMEGEIFESNVPSAIGQRILLVVEDNGVEGAKDRLAWCIYQKPSQGWVPTDAERDDDKGASLTWLATDAERKDDVGIQMPQGKLAPCKSVVGAAQEFIEFKYGGGDLVVTSRQ
jgi:hypothetical protein